MATKSNDYEEERLREVNRLLRTALDECQALVKRTEEMLRRSEQDNDKRS